MGKKNKDLLSAAGKVLYAGGKNSPTYKILLEAIDRSQMECPHKAPRAKFKAAADANKTGRWEKGDLLEWCTDCSATVRVRSLKTGKWKEVEIP